MRLLVTGCGRSGTRWVAALLTRLGVECRHEEQFTPWRHGPLRVSESSWLAVPHVGRLPAGIPVLRAVRNPFDVVRSSMRRGFLNRGDAYDAYVAHHRPDIARQATHLDRVVRYVATWDTYTPVVDVPRVGFDMPAAELACVLRGAGLDVDAYQVHRAVRAVGRVNAGPAGRAPDDGEIASSLHGHLIVERARELGYTGGLEVGSGAS